MSKPLEVAVENVGARTDDLAGRVPQLLAHVTTVVPKTRRHPGDQQRMLVTGKRPQVSASAHDVTNGSTPAFRRGWRMRKRWRTNLRRGNRPPSLSSRSRHLGQGHAHRYGDHRAVGSCTATRTWSAMVVSPNAGAAHLGWTVAVAVLTGVLIAPLVVSSVAVLFLAAVGATAILQRVSAYATLAVSI